MVVTQHTAQTLAAFDWAGRAANLHARYDDRVVEPLVVSFFVIVLHVLANGPAQHVLAKEDQPVKALRFQ